MSQSLLRSWIKQGKVKMLDKGYASKCAQWQMSFNSTGYPQTSINGTTEECHRVMLKAKLGKKLSKDQICMHKCNNKKCVNPSHLKVGTTSENTKAAYDDKLIG